MEEILKMAMIIFHFAGALAILLICWWYLKLIKKIEETREEIITRLMRTQNSIDSIEEHVKDLSLRVTLTEVRLEERKHSQLLLPEPKIPVKRGRKPKA